MGALMVIFLIAAILLVLIVLVQRGRGGGLAGALGGAGGHSAFGTKTGDVFTKATAVLATILILLAIIIGILMHSQTPEGAFPTKDDSGKSDDSGDAEKAPASDPQPKADTSNEETTE
ncbi:MAG: preprotein translocase subunit SecG [Planctomycetia bacterium]|nr:preprotein translocase subunit SecG [Planctomycetia bacterium]